ncbi:hypothetical protein [Priestia endophytica]|uniref:hypothetical protein n=1 Tax=Priestia endophytica TaxID=135735 RepID=UPI00124E016F|nr:hypothetical protein [Priestia endophytica]KAB2489986.1 hypothetical protein F8155_21585 [Priestia endophytica]
MKDNQNSKSITLLVSIYSWNREDDYDQKTQSFINPIKEDVFEVQIKNIEDMTILTHRLGCKVKYKKPTDKNWYTYRAMTKRLFKKEINESRSHLEPLFSSVIDLKKIMEERKQARLEKEREKWKLERELYDIKYELNQMDGYVEF